MNLLDALPEMGSEDYTRPVEFHRIAIWPSLLISILLHVIFFRLLMTALPRSGPAVDRCPTVALVTLGEEICRGAGEGNTAGSGMTSPVREKPETGESGVSLSNANAVPLLEEAKPLQTVAKEEKQTKAPAIRKRTERVPRRMQMAVKRDKPEMVKAPQDLSCSKPEAMTSMSAVGRTPESGRAASAAGSNEAGSRENAGGGIAQGAGSTGGGGGNSRQGGVANARLGAADGPSFLRKVLPKYPSWAREQGKEGTVVLRVTIDARGLPVCVELMKKAGYGLDDEAVRAIQNSTFVPARIEGKLVVCKVLVPVRFQLDEAEDE